MLLTLPIASISRATPRAITLRLDLAGQRFPYRAGQAVLAGRAGQPVRRPYSLAIAPHEAEARRELELLVGLDVEGTPGPHMAALAPGSLVDVEGPVGAFAFPADPQERRFLFLAGGTGIAPLRAMLHEALARDSGWQLGVLYSARSPDEFAYGDELARLAAERAITLRQVVTRPDGRAWSGARGRVNRDLIAELADANTLCFLCGPHAFVEAMLGLLAKGGIPGSKIRVEDWGVQ
jgi:ferredoxin-NADP reductase